MKVKWKKLIIKIAAWLFAEILLNFLGFDTLADYGEFVFDKHLVSSKYSNLIIKDLAMTTPINQNGNLNRKHSPKHNVVQFSKKLQSKDRQAAAYRGRGFRAKFKIYTGEHLHAMQVIQRLAGTVIPTVFPWAALCAGYGFLISLLNHWGLLNSIVGSKSVADTIAGLNLALGLLLVFRTNTAHDRFWEGRKLWGAMVNVVRNLTRGIWIYIQEDGIQDHKDKESSMRLVPAFSTSMKQHLRRERPNSEIEALVSPQQYLQLQQAQHVPLELALWIGDYLQRCYENEKLNVFQLTDLQNSVDEMVDILGGCERILKTPVPLVYTIALKALLLVYFAVSPIGLVGGLGWGTSLVTGFIGFIYLSIDEVGAEIEEPFGHDPNDLPLDFICDTIEGNVEDLIQHSPDSSKIINLPNINKRAA
jgi:ion channel-forming bestrophin family protein